MERFWSKVDKSPGHGPNGDCWVWTAARQKYGYGKFSWGHANWVSSHRFAWSIDGGEIPDGMFVLHKCDNPPCVRPDHLFLGTPADNMRDMEAKGRAKKPGPTIAARGERVGSSKLRTEDVVRLRKMHADGSTSRSLASEFGVTEAMVKRIVRGKAWTHIPIARTALVTI